MSKVQSVTEPKDIFYYYQSNDPDVILRTKQYYNGLKKIGIDDIQMAKLKTASDFVKRDETNQMPVFGLKYSEIAPYKELANNYRSLVSSVDQNDNAYNYKMGLEKDGTFFIEKKNLELNKLQDITVGNLWDAFKSTLTFKEETYDYPAFNKAVIEYNKEIHQRLIKLDELKWDSKISDEDYKRKKQEYENALIEVDYKKNQSIFGSSGTIASVKDLTPEQNIWIRRAMPKYEFDIWKGKVEDKKAQTESGKFFTSLGTGFLDGINMIPFIDYNVTGDIKEEDKRQLAMFGGEEGEKILQEESKEDSDLTRMIGMGIGMSLGLAVVSRAGAVALATIGIKLGTSNAVGRVLDKALKVAENPTYRFGDFFRKGVTVQKGLYAKELGQRLTIGGIEGWLTLAPKATEKFFSLPSADQTTERFVNDVAVSPFLDLSSERMILGPKIKRDWSGIKKLGGYFTESVVINTVTEEANNIHSDLTLNTRTSFIADNLRWMFYKYNNRSDSYDSMTSEEKEADDARVEAEYDKTYHGGDNLKWKVMLTSAVSGAVIGGGAQGISTATNLYKDVQSFQKVKSILSDIEKKMEADGIKLAPEDYKEASTLLNSIIFGKKVHDILKESNYSTSRLISELYLGMRDTHKVDDKGISNVVDPEVFEKYREQANTMIQEILSKDKEKTYNPFFAYLLTGRLISMDLMTDNRSLDYYNKTDIQELYDISEYFSKQYEAQTTNLNLVETTKELEKIFGSYTDETNKKKIDEVRNYLNEQFRTNPSINIDLEKAFPDLTPQQYSAVMGFYLIKSAQMNSPEIMRGRIDDMAFSLDSYFTNKILDEGEKGVDLEFLVNVFSPEMKDVPKSMLKSRQALDVLASFVKGYAKQYSEGKADINLSPEFEKAVEIFMGLGYDKINAYDHYLAKVNKDEKFQENYFKSIYQKNPLLFEQFMAQAIRDEVTIDEGKASEIQGILASEISNKEKIEKIEGLLSPEDKVKAKLLVDVYNKHTGYVSKPSSAPVKKKVSIEEPDKFKARGNTEDDLYAEAMEEGSSADAKEHFISISKDLTVPSIMDKSLLKDNFSLFSLFSAFNTKYGISDKTTLKELYNILIKIVSTDNLPSKDYAHALFYYITLVHELKANLRNKEAQKLVSDYEKGILYNIIPALAKKAKPYLESVGSSYFATTTQVEIKNLFSTSITDNVMTKVMIALDSQDFKPKLTTVKDASSFRVNIGRGIDPFQILYEAIHQSISQKGYVVTAEGAVELSKTKSEVEVAVKDNKFLTDIFNKNINEFISYLDTLTDDQIIEFANSNVTADPSKLLLFSFFIKKKSKESKASRRKSALNMVSVKLADQLTEYLLAKETWEDPVEKLIFERVYEDITNPEKSLENILIARKSFEDAQGLFGEDLSKKQFEFFARLTDVMLNYQVPMLIDEKMWNSLHKDFKDFIMYWYMLKDNRTYMVTDEYKKYSGRFLPQRMADAYNNFDLKKYKEKEITQFAKALGIIADNFTDKDIAYYSVITDLLSQAKISSLQAPETPLQPAIAQEAPPTMAKEEIVAPEPVSEQNQAIPEESTAKSNFDSALEDFVKENPEYAEILSLSGVKVIETKSLQMGGIPRLGTYSPSSNTISLSTSISRQYSARYQAVLSHELIHAEFTRLYNSSTDKNKAELKGLVVKTISNLKAFQKLFNAIDAYTGEGEARKSITRKIASFRRYNPELTALYEEVRNQFQLSEEAFYNLVVVLSGQKKSTFMKTLDSYLESIDSAKDSESELIAILLTPNHNPVTLLTYFMKGEDIPVTKSSLLHKILNKIIDFINQEWKVSNELKSTMIENIVEVLSRGDTMEKLVTPSPLTPIEPPKKLDETAEEDSFENDDLFAFPDTPIDNVQIEHDPDSVAGLGMINEENDWIYSYEKLNTLIANLISLIDPKSPLAGIADKYNDFDLVEILNSIEFDEFKSFLLPEVNDSKQASKYKKAVLDNIFIGYGIPKWSVANLTPKSQEYKALKDLWTKIKSLAYYQNFRISSTIDSVTKSKSDKKVTRLPFVFRNLKKQRVASYRNKMLVSDYLPILKEIFGIDFEIGILENIVLYETNDIKEGFRNTKTSVEEAVLLLFESGIIFPNRFADKKSLPLFFVKNGSGNYLDYQDRFAHFADLYKKMRNKYQDKGGTWFQDEALQMIADRKTADKRAIGNMISLVMRGILEEIRIGNTVENIKNGNWVGNWNATKEFKRWALTSNVMYSQINEEERKFMKDEEYPLPPSLKRELESNGLGHYTKLISADPNAPFFYAKNDQTGEYEYFMNIAVIDSRDFYNAIGLSRVDGAGIGIMGLTDQVLSIAQGLTKSGNLKNVIFGQFEENNPSNLYLKHAMGLWSSNNSLIKAMIRQGIGFLAIDESEKNGTFPREKMTTLSELTGAKINEFDSGKKVAIPLKNIQRILEGESDKNTVFGLHQILSACGIISKNPGITIEGDILEVFSKANVDRLNELSTESPSEISKKLVLFKKAFFKAIDNPSTQYEEVFSRMFSDYKTKRTINEAELLKEILPYATHPVVENVLKGYLNNTVKNYAKFGHKGSGLVLMPDLGNHADFLVKKVKEQLSDAFNPTLKKYQEEVYNLNNARHSLRKKINDPYTNDVEKELSKSSLDAIENRLKDLKIMIDTLRNKISSGTKVEGQEVVQKIIDEAIDSQTGFLNNGWIIIDVDTAIMNNLKPGDEVIVYLIPTDSAMGVSTQKIAGIIDTANMPNSSIVMNSEYVQLIGRDYDFDKMYLMAYDRNMLTPEEWSKFKNIFRGVAERYTDMIYDFINSNEELVQFLQANVKDQDGNPVFTRTAKGFHERAREIFNSKTEIQKYYMIWYVGANKNTAPNYVMGSVETFELGDKYHKDVGKIINLRNLHNLLMLLDVKTEVTQGKTKLLINFENVSRNEFIKHHFAMLIATNDEVDYPKNNNKDYYNNEIQNYLSALFGFKDVPRGMSGLNTTLFNVFGKFFDVPRFRSFNGFDAISSTLQRLNKAKFILSMLKNGELKELLSEEETELVKEFFKNLTYNPDGYKNSPLLSFIDQMDLKALIKEIKKFNPFKDKADRFEYNSLVEYNTVWNIFNQYFPDSGIKEAIEFIFSPEFAEYIEKSKFGVNTNDPIFNYSPVLNKLLNNYMPEGYAYRFVISSPIEKGLNILIKKRTEALLRYLKGLLGNKRTKVLEMINWILDPSNPKPVFLLPKSFRFTKGKSSNILHTKEEFDNIAGEKYKVIRFESELSSIAVSPSNKNDIITVSKDISDSDLLALLNKISEEYDSNIVENVYLAEEFAFFLFEKGKISTDVLEFTNRTVFNNINQNEYWDTTTRFNKLVEELFRSMIKDSNKLGLGVINKENVVTQGMKLAQNLEKFDGDSSQLRYFVAKSLHRADVSALLLDRFIDELYYKQKANVFSYTHPQLGDVKGIENILVMKNIIRYLFKFGSLATEEDFNENQSARLKEIINIFERVREKARLKSSGKYMSAYLENPMYKMPEELAGKFPQEGVQFLSGDVTLTVRVNKKGELEAVYKDKTNNKTELKDFGKGLPRNSRIKDFINDPETWNGYNVRQLWQHFDVQEDSFTTVDRVMAVSNIMKESLSNGEITLPQLEFVFLSFLQMPYQKSELGARPQRKTDADNLLVYNLMAQFTPDFLKRYIEQYGKNNFLSYDDYMKNAKGLHVNIESEIKGKDENESGDPVDSEESLYDQMSSEDMLGFPDNVFEDELDLETKILNDSKNIPNLVADTVKTFPSVAEFKRLLETDSEKAKDKFKQIFSDYITIASLHYLDHPLSHMAELPAEKIEKLINNKLNAVLKKSGEITIEETKPEDLLNLYAHFITYKDKLKKVKFSDVRLNQTHLVKLWLISGKPVFTKYIPDYISLGIDYIKKDITYSRTELINAMFGYTTSPSPYAPLNLEQITHYKQYKIFESISNLSLEAQKILKQISLINNSYNDIKDIVEISNLSYDILKELSKVKIFITKKGDELFFSESVTIPENATAEQKAELKARMGQKTLNETTVKFANRLFNNSYTKKQLDAVKSALLHKYIYQKMSFDIFVTTKHFITKFSDIAPLNEFQRAEVKKLKMKYDKFLDAITRGVSNGKINTEGMIKQNPRLEWSFVPKIYSASTFVNNYVVSNYNERLKSFTEYSTKFPDSPLAKEMQSPDYAQNLIKRLEEEAKQKLKGRNFYIPFFSDIRDEKITGDIQNNMLTANNFIFEMLNMVKKDMTHLNYFSYINASIQVNNPPSIVRGAKKLFAGLLELDIDHQQEMNVLDTPEGSNVSYFYYAEGEEYNPEIQGWMTVMIARKGTGQIVKIDKEAKKVYLRRFGEKDVEVEFDNIFSFEGEKGKWNVIQKGLWVKFKELQLLNDLSKLSHTMTLGLAGFLRYASMNWMGIRFSSRENYPAHIVKSPTTFAEFVSTNSTANMERDAQTDLDQISENAEIIRRALEGVNNINNSIIMDIASGQVFEQSPDDISAFLGKINSIESSLNESPQINPEESTKGKRAKERKREKFFKLAIRNDAKTYQAFADYVKKLSEEAKKALLDNDMNKFNQIMEELKTIQTRDYLIDNLESLNGELGQIAHSIAEGNLAYALNIDDRMAKNMSKKYLSELINRVSFVRFPQIENTGRSMHFQMAFNLAMESKKMTIEQAAAYASGQVMWLDGLYDMLWRRLGHKENLNKFMNSLIHYSDTKRLGLRKLLGEVNIQRKKYGLASVVLPTILTKKFYPPKSLEASQRFQRILFHNILLDNINHYIFGASFFGNVPIMVSLNTIRMILDIMNPDEEEVDWKRRDTLFLMGQYIALARGLGGGMLFSLYMGLTLTDEYSDFNDIFRVPGLSSIKKLYDLVSFSSSEALKDFTRLTIGLSISRNWNDFGILPYGGGNIVQNAIDFTVLLAFLGVPVGHEVLDRFVDKPTRDKIIQINRGIENREESMESKIRKYEPPERINRILEDMLP